MSKKSLIDIENFPEDGISIFGLSFHAENISNLIEKRQGIETVAVFKGTLREEEAYQHIKKLNDSSPHPGLELLVKGYEIANEDEEETIYEAKILWREFVKISGLYPNFISKLSKDICNLKEKDISVDRIDNTISIFILHSFEVYQKGLMKIELEAFQDGQDQEKIGYFHNFLYGAAQSFLKGVQFEVPPETNRFWDYRFVTCEKWNPGNAFSHIPLFRPKALSRPHAGAMYEVSSQFYLIIDSLHVLVVFPIPKLF